MTGVGTTDPEVSKTPEGGKKIDAELQDKIRDGTFTGSPIEVCDSVLGENNYQIIIFDSDGKKDYVTRRTIYGPDNKFLKMADTAKLIDEEATKIASTEVNTNELKHKIYTIKTEVATDIEGGVGVLKLIDGPTINEELKNEEETKGKLLNGEILNKDQLSKVLCNKISNELSKESEIKEQFELSSSLLQAAKNDFKTKTEREQASSENLNKAKSDLLEAIVI